MFFSRDSTSGVLLSVLHYVLFPAQRKSFIPVQEDATVSLPHMREQRVNSHTIIVGVGGGGYWLLPYVQISTVQYCIIIAV